MKAHGLPKPVRGTEASADAGSGERAPVARQSGGPAKGASAHGPDCPCVRCTGFQKGHTLSRRHGAYSLVSLEPRALELAGEIRELVPARSDADEISIRLLALALAQVEGASTWLAEHGLVDEHGNARSLLRHLGTMMNTAARIADRLGMTPTSRAQLGLDLTRAKGEALRAHLDERYSEEVGS